jgi:hypothetical protein
MDWIKIEKEDDLSEIGVRVLVYGFGSQPTMENRKDIFMDIRHGIVKHHNGFFTNPTHWMPLPSKPIEK